MTGISTVECHRIGPFAREDAEYIKLLQEPPNYKWGYVPMIYERQGSWYLIMYGEKDAAEAERLIRTRKG